jgi:hypothetical protein
MASQNAARAADRSRGGSPQNASSVGTDDKSKITKSPPPAQHLSDAGFETLCAASREEIGMLFSEIAARAETGILYVGLADERGIRYAVNNIVNLSVRMGDEALQLRRLRTEARAAEADRLSVLRQGESGQ